MKKNRTPIPLKRRRAILKEYDHACALCLKNSPGPELHHIDEDPSNHDPLNILPLCPNCHALKPDSRILAIFRKYKKREILSVKFEHLLKKAAFLYELAPLHYFPYCFAPGEDLVAFVLKLKQGKYYAPKLNKIIYSDTEAETSTLEEVQAYDKKRRENIIDLLVDLLPFQNWKPKNLPGQLKPTSLDS